MKYDPYKTCLPVKGELVTLRLLEPKDAEDLLVCYSDERAVALMNADNCSGSFLCKKLENMQEAIKWWLVDCKASNYIRYTILDNASGVALGTIEIFNRGENGGYPNVGVLRLDIRFDHETDEYLRDILTLVQNELFEPFGLEGLMLKAPTAGKTRRAVLEDLGYRETAPGEIVPWEHWYFATAQTLFTKALTRNMGRCGLVCGLCLERATLGCKGCVSDKNCCGRHLSRGGCHQYDCSLAKGLRGCWECPDGPCNEDMFAAPHDRRNRIFVAFAREHGVEELARRVWRNQQAGIRYGYQLDYDGLPSDQAVLDLLEKGK